MKTVVWTEHTAWEATVRQAEQEDVLVIRDGHVVALLMPFDDDDLSGTRTNVIPSSLLRLPGHASRFKRAGPSTTAT